MFPGWTLLTIQVITALLCDKFDIFKLLLVTIIDGVDGDTKSVSTRPFRKEGETGAVLREKSTPADITS